MCAAQEESATALASSSSMRRSSRQGDVYDVQRFATDMLITSSRIDPYQQITRSGNVSRRSRS